LQSEPTNYPARPIKPRLPHQPLVAPQQVLEELASLEDLEIRQNSASPRLTNRRRASVHIYVLHLPTQTTPQLERSGDFCSLALDPRFDGKQGAMSHRWLSGAEHGISYLPLEHHAGSPFCCPMLAEVIANGCRWRGRTQSLAGCWLWAAATGKSASGGVVQAHSENLLKAQQVPPPPAVLLSETSSWSSTVGLVHLNLTWSRCCDARKGRVYESQTVFQCQLWRRFGGGGHRLPAGGCSGDER